MLKADLHVHSDFSTDGEAGMEAICEAAIDNGLETLAITDHADFVPMAPTFDAPAYLEKVDALKNKFNGRLKVLAGVEVGYRAGAEEEIAAFTSQPFDMVIGVVHEVGEGTASITEEYGALEYFNKTPIPEAFEKYLLDVEQCVKSGWFDVLGHIDIIDRFGVRFAEKMQPLEHYGILKRILEGVVKREMALEINTSGLRHACENIYPSSDILKLYQELGGVAVTIGSDSHCPDHLGGGFDEAQALLAEFELLKPVIFEKRRLILCG